MSNTIHTQQTTYKPGDVANGHRLSEDGRWEQISAVSASSPKRRGRVLIPTVAGLAGLMVGIGLGAAGTSEVAVEDSPEYQALERTVATLESDVASEAQRADAAEGELADLAAREAAVADAEAAVAEREAAVTVTEQQIDASRLEPGIYIVGTDIEPGQYRTLNDVSGLCYFAQKDGESILWNDISDVGRPVATVQNAPGTTFEIDRECGPVQKIN
jgi:hypothetical protein